MQAQIRRVIWLLAAVIWPLTFLLTWVIAPPKIDGTIWPVIGMGVLMILISLSSFKVKETNIFVVGGLSLAAFLIYGVFVEMVLMQMALFTGMLKRRLAKEEWFRYAFNMTMFILMSAFSALVFYALGGETGVAQEVSFKIWPTLGYVLTSFILNQTILYYFYKVYYGTGELFGKDVLVELINTAVVSPIGVIFYFIYIQLESLSILIMAVPIVTMAIIFWLINNSYELNDLLRKTNEAGSQLAEKLNVQEIHEMFFSHLNKILKTDYVFILQAEEDSRHYAIKSYFICPQVLEEYRVSAERSVRWPTELTRKNFLAGTRKDWRRLLKGFLPVSAQSVLVIPTHRHQDTLGAVVCASEKRRLYGKQHLMVLEILTNFFFIAIENAESYERKKRESECDPLTGLYNYRYFTKLLETQYQLANGKPFSIVMIDLDHFKLINDTYGHENGNIILKEVAKRLCAIIGDRGTVARYGGEEFILLIPDTGSQLCYEMAEEIRQRISSEPFLITTSGDHKRLVHVTASIGLATAPGQGEDPLSLIRNADRAMYAGAKQRGRNRVATYIG
ncbi:GGDEF domain-containing protein [Tuberibacillus calidus]|jgi:diguanylate cyclase (GGDEF)-like protein|uniref:GGDEF domain-containing protein n=1 Tax=Tuberibacillus calidus TaxID=340097 RepID=UPI0004125431|nr:sensor domain-containing diguanylate cyclase [Tuberibacillus calidus]